MAFLNEKNDYTKKIIHIMVTELCDRNCAYCCNKQYNIEDIPKVTDEELKEAEILFLTGGEPFAYTQPEKIANYYKSKYSNIKKVFVYTNAVELSQYFFKHKDNYERCRYRNLSSIDGLTISIKNKIDAKVFDELIKNDEEIKSLESNKVYVFNNLYPIKNIEGFSISSREWQEDFTPADDSIFRRA